VVAAAATAPEGAHEELQCEDAPEDAVAPGAVVLEVVRPAAPRGDRLIQALLELAARREHEWLLVGRAESDVDGAVAGQPRRFQAITEARLDPPAHRYSSRERFDAALQLAIRSEAPAGKRQCVGDPHGPCVRPEGRLQDVGAGQIAPFDFVGNGRAEQEAAAALGVEQGCEDGRRVEIG